jgi:hypothetical protein
MTNPRWHSDIDTVHSVATYAVEQGEVTTLEDLLYLFEKPWKYEELYEAYLEEAGENA